MRPIIFLCVVFFSLLSSFFPAAGQKSDPCYKNWVDSARNAIKVQNYRQAFDFYLDAFSEKSPKIPYIFMKRLLCRQELYMNGLRLCF